MKKATETQKGARIVALAYIVFFPVSALLFLALETDGYINIVLSKPILYIGICVALIFVALSFFKISLTRRLIIRALFGIFIVAPPFVFSWGLLSFAYLFTVNPQVRFWLILQFIIYTTLWGAYCIKVRKELMIKSNYMAKYFKITDTEIIYAPPKKDPLIEPPISDNTVLGRLWNKHAYKLLILTYCGYPLQRLLNDYGGHQAVYLALFIIGGSLTMYALAKLAPIIYLIVYKSYELESQYGKPVLLSEKNDPLI